MDEVPLTDAIRNLARQAGINYMLDPKVAFGQPGPEGKAAPQPLVSIRWENITAEQALNALLKNYDLQLIDDPKTHIGRVTVKDPAAPDPLVTRIHQLQYAGTSNLLTSVQTTLSDRRSKVVADVRTSQLVVLATEREMIEVGQLIQRLDTPTKQVLIEAKLLETTFNPTTSKGINWSGTLQNQGFTFGNGKTTGTTTSTTKTPGDTVSTTTTYGSGRSVTTTSTPGESSSTTSSLTSVLGGGGLSYNTLSGLSPSTGFLTADGVSAVLSFLNANADAKVLSEPRTVTLDNEPAMLSVTRATPIINVTAGNQTVTGGSQVTYTNLGVLLNVTPRISANKFVNLKISPEVSRYIDTVTKTVNGQTSQADEYDLRRIETQVLVPSGNTLVLGGLMQDDTSSSSTKVPILGDIPVLGYLFRSSTKARLKSNLLIFITPTIVKDSDFQPTQTAFLKTSMHATADPDWSAWDTAEPYDWSRSKKKKSKDAPAPAETAQPSHFDNGIPANSPTITNAPAVR